MIYRGYEIVTDRDLEEFTGETHVYVHTNDGGDPIEVASIEAAKAVIDQMIRDMAEYEADDDE